MMLKEITNWYNIWFNTPYYHTLYKDRDYEEAQLFMNNLTQYLNLPEESKVLDLACGKGRHSIYLNKLGYDVVGVDLSPNSIKSAKEHENEKLHFHVHDMLEPLPEKFDAIFNLFTSFGYFSDYNENVRALEVIKNGLSEYGFAVIDFMNVNKVIPNLVSSEIKTVDGIEFNLKRRFEDGLIIKDISFDDNGEHFEFTERVKALELKDFENMMQEADINLLDIFGDYKLNKFDNNESDRLIMIFK